jgi:hypothetical protein
MKSYDKNLDSTLDRYMGQAGEPPAVQVESSVDAVWERLRPEAEFAKLPVREMSARRFPFTVLAAVALVTAAIGLYAAQRTGLFRAMFPVAPQAQHQAQTQVAPASQSEAVSVDPTPERVASDGAAEAKEPTVTSRPPRFANAPAPAPFAPTAPLLREPERNRLLASPEQVRSQGATIPGTPLAFEVAAIRLVQPPYPNESGPWTASNGRFSADRAWVRGLVAVAYELNKARLVKGGPDWIDQEQYDIDARAGNPAAGLREIRLMLRTLMTERFKLAVHRSTEESMAYTLVVAKNGSKLQNVRNPLLTSTKWDGPGKVTFSDHSGLVGLINVLGGSGLR